jgi:hypothetical protein
MTGGLVGGVVGGVVEPQPGSVMLGVATATFKWTSTTAVALATGAATTDATAPTDPHNPMRAGMDRHSRDSTTGRNELLDEN